MRKLTPVQTSFSSGEISPRLYGRTDANGYQSGAQTMQNFIADPRGPARRRPGSQFIRSFPGDDGRVYLFSVTESSGYAIVLLDEALIPLSYEGTVPAANYTINGRFRAGSFGWTTSITQGSVIFTADRTRLICNDSGNATVSIGQQVTVPASGDFIAGVGSLEGGPYRVRIGTAINDGTYGDFIVASGVFTQVVSIPGTTAWITVTNETRDSSVTINGVSFKSTTPSAPVATPWKVQELEDLQLLRAPGGSTLYMIHPNYAPRKLVYDFSTDTFSFTTVTFTNPPAVWAGSSWPRCGTFHQGRLWLGGNPEDPQSFWASKSNLFENFTLGSLADDALAFTLSEQGDLRWMISAKNLLIGTNLGEHIVTAEQGVITPSDIQVDQQSAYGSTRMQALRVGDQVFYISPDRVKIRAMQYEWTADNWLSNDITFFAEHITRSGVQTFAWAQNPDHKLACALKNGKMALLTYERGENIFGWSLHDFGAPVRALASGNVEGEDIVIMLVNRVPGEVYFELMRNTPVQYVDSWVRQSFPTPQATFNGLDHLEDQEVQILANGAVHPPRVVMSGSVTLDYPATDVVVGVKYTAKLVTLPLDKGSQTGSAIPHKKGFGRIFVRLLDSALPLINGERPPTRNPSTPMNTPEPLVSAVIDVNRRGWDEEAQLTIEQDLPLNCIVTSIAAEVAQEIL